MANETVQTKHYKRQFLAPEQTRDDQATCYSYVYVGTTPDDVDIETEFVLSDGWNTVHLDLNQWNDEPEIYLQLITRLMEQVMEYRQVVAEAIAVQHGQSITR